MSCIDPRAFRTVLGRFATGIVVVSTRVDGVPHAMTANAFMSGSLEPPLVLVSIGRKARIHDLLASASSYGVAVLTEDEERYSRHFSGQRAASLEPRFMELGGAPVLAGGSARLGARIVHRYDCGDHTLFVGEVHALELGDAAQPLVFHAGRYALLAPVAGSSVGPHSAELPFLY